MIHVDRWTNMTLFAILRSSFSTDSRLKCFNAFVINVLSTGPTKGFNLYWTTQSIFDAARITKKKKYVNFCVLLLLARL